MIPRFLVCALLIGLAGPIHATSGLTGQPTARAETIRAIRTATTKLIAGEDTGAARPALFEAVEADSSADLSDLLAPVVAADPVSYTGLLTVFEDALAGAQPPKSDFVRFNLAQIHYLRGLRLPTGPERTRTLAAASRVAAAFDPRRSDPEAWALAGDISLAQNNLDTALERYRNIPTAGGSRARMYLKVAQAYHTRFRYDDARAASLDGIRADTAAIGRKMTRHALFQTLAAAFLAQNRVGDAADALVQSAKVQPDEKAPYRLRLDIAWALHKRGGAARQVLEYARAAAAFTPDDSEAQALLAAVQGRKDTQ
jgi:cytochrome c-type biogenesis protein CcmH/NrfG